MTPADTTMKTAKYYLVFFIDDFTNKLESKSFDTYKNAWYYANAVQGCVKPVY